MTLNFTGPISLGGPTTGQSINLELGKGASDQAALNDTDVRALAQVTTPASKIVMPTDFWGKAYSYIYYFISKVLSGIFTGGGLVIDSDNNSYVVSLDGGDLPTTTTIGIQKYYPNNSIQAQKYISASTTLATADTYLDFGFNSTYYPRLVLDTSNNLYFTHVAHNANFNYSRITKLDSNLNQVWVRTYTSTGYNLFVTNPVYWVDAFSGYDYIFYANAYSYIPDPETGAYYAVITVFKLNNLGYPVLTTQLYPALGNFYTQIYTAATRTDRIYIGASYGASGRVYQLDNFTLAIQKTISFNDTNWYGVEGRVVSICSDTSGYTYFVVNGSDAGGYYGSYLVKYDPGILGGVISWQRQIIDTSYYTMQCAATDSSNNIYVAGTSSSGSCIIKYNDNGVIQWARQFTGLAPITSIAIINSKNTICIASTVTGSTSVFKVPTDGSKTGTYTVGGSTITYSALSITDAAGSLSVTFPSNPTQSFASDTQLATTQTLSNSSLTLDVTYL